MLEDTINAIKKAEADADGVVADAESKAQAAVEKA